ncbi:hypothetical protein [Streptomyces sp. H39-S7]|uniref:hypothetical protein n=1 Tax=Streptomyces sp. H39-S7 TaxID=3004357 RepID=UPI0022AE58D8|nr:hypothetical protein [Streptomyces sp. H39-S7]MCZ4118107.1 hypothetical protein [Streptomyces sp. H39-S7]
MVFSTDPRHGLVARSGWEQEEARAVLHDLGWEWREELHALVSPDDMPDLDAGVQAVEELHFHGHRAGYAVGPYGTMRLTLEHAEQVFTKAAARETSEPRPDTAHGNHANTTKRCQSAYSQVAAEVEPVTPEAPDSPSV